MRLTTVAATSSGGGGRGAPKSSAPPPPPPVDLAQLSAAFSKLLDDPEPSTRLAALQGLSSIGSKLGDEPPPALKKALDDPDAAIQATAIAAMARFSHGADSLLPAVVRNLGEKTAPELRAAADAALSTIRPSSVSAAGIAMLVPAIKNPDPEIRHQIIVLLSKTETNGQDAIPAFIAALKEPADTDRPVASVGPVIGNARLTGPAYVAAEALGKRAPHTKAAGQAVTALEEAFRSGPRQRRASVATALGQFGPEAAPAFPALAAALAEMPESDSSSDRKTFADAIGRIAPGTPASRAAITALEPALKSKSPSAREAAAKALECFGPQAKDAIPALKSLLTDPDPKARSAAVAAIKALEK